MARELWVFGYGSLMWRPGFPFVEAHRAHLTGFRRCFCVYSIHHRGTRARPGLVLGLDRGGACTGIAFRVKREHAVDVRNYLRAREQVEGVYRSVDTVVELEGEGREVTALAFVVERSHRNYARSLPLATQARIIASAAGISGSNADYLINTLSHLREMEIRERELERILALVGPHAARIGQSDDGLARPTSVAMQRVLRQRPSLVPPRPGKNPSRRFLYRLREGTGAVRTAPDDGRTG